LKDVGNIPSRGLGRLRVAKVGVVVLQSSEAFNVVWTEKAVWCACFFISLERCLIDRIRSAFLVVRSAGRAFSRK
jgi:hypothetical protein